jgi:hypothetical protein
MKIRLIPHEPISKTGSYEVRFPDGRPPRYFYRDDIAGRRCRTNLVDGAAAESEAKVFAVPSRES